jgi:hypothetical protein
VRKVETLSGATGETGLGGAHLLSLLRRTGGQPLLQVPQVTGSICAPE